MFPMCTCVIETSCWGRHLRAKLFMRPHKLAPPSFTGSASAFRSAATPGCKLQTTYCTAWCALCGTTEKAHSQLFPLVPGTVSFACSFFDRTASPQGQLDCGSVNFGRWARHDRLSHSLTHFVPIPYYGIRPVQLQRSPEG